MDSSHLPALGATKVQWQRLAASTLASAQQRCGMPRPLAPLAQSRSCASALRSCTAKQRVRCVVLCTRVGQSAHVQ